MSKPDDTPGDAVVSMPQDTRGDRVFREPWEAQVFALAVSLSERGAFKWREWADCFSRELKANGANPDGGDYYLHWLGALEKLADAKGLTSAHERGRRQNAWQRAARATPHGKPIVLNSCGPTDCDPGTAPD